jgi:phosphoserine phosphatase RsbU/P
MLTVVFRTLLREFHTHRMARFAALVMCSGAALATVDYLTKGVAASWWLAYWIALSVASVYYLARLIRLVRTRLLWRLRWRLLVTYVFIAVVPIVLIVALVAVGAFIINGQFAAFLVNLRLRDQAENLAQLNRAVIHEVHQSSPVKTQDLLKTLQDFYVSELSQHTASYPGLEITLRLGSEVRAFRLDRGPAVSEVRIPEWLKEEEFSGFVIDQGQIELRSVARTQTPEGELFIVLSQPFTPELLDLVGGGIGPVGILVPIEGGAPRPVPPRRNPDQNASAGRRRIPPIVTVSSKLARVPPAANFFDFNVYGASTLGPIIWRAPERRHLQQPVFIYASSRIVTLNRQLFGTLGQYSQFYITAFVALAVVFLALEVLALIVGVRLTRTMTTTVDNLYNATERVKAGDFSYRITIPARDQLSALGQAFDTMTASVERLLKESQEKLRLESELVIAREVQNQLFPREIPAVRGLELLGMCRPASGVSGDYYDFLRLDEDRVGIVLGDVSGKGISAALLMAAIQSALRAQIKNGYSPTSHPGSAIVSTASVVARLNRQLHESTPIEKYSTFFLAVYDGKTRKLTYTNAGHLSPVLFRRDSMERLDVGGTVIGMFASVDYLESEVQLYPGDVLLAFTDGLTEPENTYGEEFGEARLLEAARRALGGPPESLVEEIYRSVGDWTGSPELQDDMTVIIAKCS